jgi:hypothetical protein
MEYDFYAQIMISPEQLKAGKVDLSIQAEEGLKDKGLDLGMELVSVNRTWEWMHEQQSLILKIQGNFKRIKNAHS